MTKSRIRTKCGPIVSVEPWNGAIELEIDNPRDWENGAWVQLDHKEAVQLVAALTALIDAQQAGVS